MKPSEIFDTPQASGFDRVTSENTIEKILNDFIKYAHEPDCIEKLRTTLTQYHQDMMSEVVEKIEQLPTQSGNDYGIAYKRAGDYKQEVLTIIKSK